jgi:hypothetical protein
VKKTKTLSNRERRKLKGKAERKAERNFRRRWFVAVAKNPCGCCETEMLFDSKESATAAFQRADLNHTSITDDNGTVHENVDTFYGFWEKGKEEGRGLGHLYKLVVGQKQWP